MNSQSKNENNTDETSSWTLFSAFSLTGIFLLFFTPSISFTIFHKIFGIIFLDLAIFGAGKSLDENNNTTAFSDMSLGIMVFFITLELIYVFPITNPVANLILETVFLIFAGYGFMKGLLKLKNRKIGSLHSKTNNKSQKERIKSKISFDSLINLGSFLVAVIALFFQIIYK